MSQQQQMTQQQQVQRLALEEQQRLAAKLRVAEIVNTCHRKCMKSPDVLRLSASERTCFERCAERHFDAQMATGAIVGKHFSDELTK
jgi:hypothetical protein